MDLYPLADISRTMRLLILTSVVVLLLGSAQGLVVEQDKRGVTCPCYSCYRVLNFIANYGSNRWHKGMALNDSGQPEMD